MAKNKKFWLNKTIFNNDFISKILRVYVDIKIKSEQDYAKFSARDLQATGIDEQFDAFKFVITFFLTVTIRSKERGLIQEYLKLITDALKANIGLSMWLLETFTNQEIIKEFLLDCPIHDLTRFVQGLLRVAMEEVYKHEKDAMAQYLSTFATKEGPKDHAREILGDNLMEDVQADGHTGKFKTLDEKEFNIYSECSQFPVLRVKNLGNVPRLVALMNSLIHFTTSQTVKMKWRFTGLYWAIFARFARLGTYARLYML